MKPTPKDLPEQLIFVGQYLDGLLTAQEFADKFVMWLHSATEDETELVAGMLALGMKETFR